MKSNLFICLAILFLSNVYCGIKNINKFQREIPLLDQEVKIKIQNVLSALPKNKIPLEFKDPKDDKWELLAFNNKYL
jgi:hypothetical protein